MSSYAEALREFYNGEVYGETLFSALVGLARNADERLKWSMLLQLETETKAWLRAPMVAHDLSIEERTEDRDKGLARARERASLPWPQAMQSMYDGLSGHYVPLYQGFADAARARGEAEEEAVCLYTKRPWSNSLGVNWPGQAWCNHSSPCRNISNTQ
jgi:hypothetical protein